MMDKKTIQHIAKLSRLRLTESEENKMKDELSAVLDFIDQLNSVDTESVEPLYQTTGVVNSFRADDHRGDFKMDDRLNDKLINQAPNKENRFVKVKSVLKK